MKKLAAVAVCLLLAAAIIRGIGGEDRPAELTINVTLGADGADVTNRVRLLVGFVDGDPSAEPTLGNMTLITPSEGEPPRYTVPDGQPVGVFAMATGFNQLQTVVNLEPGQNRHETLVLKGGFVNVTTLRSPDQPVREATLEGPRGRNGGSVGRPLMLPSGTHRFSTAQETIDVTVTAGSDQTITLDDRFGQVRFSATSALDLGATLRGVRYVAERDAERYVLRNEGWLPFGTYTVAPFLVSNSWMGLPQDNKGDAQPVVVGPGMVTATFPLDVHVVHVDPQNWDPDDLDIVDAMIFVKGGNEAPMAMTRVVDGRATLVFLSQPTVQTYAVALAKRRRVVAIQDIGPVPLNDPRAVALSAGGDRALCTALGWRLNCDTLD